MRALTVLAAAALMVGVSATISVAEPVSGPAVVAADGSNPSLRQARVDYGRAMADMQFEIHQAVNPNEIREITARYQPKADALADLVEARLAAGEPVAARYRNPERFREYPARTRHDALRTRLLNRDSARPVSARAPRLG